jgi:hypothetical protein
MNERGRLGPAANLIDPLNWGFAAPFPPMLANNSAAIGFAGRAVFARLMSGGVISKVRFQVTVSAGNISVAAYRNTGIGAAATPGARLAVSSTVACPATGVAEVSLGATVTLLPGDWLAFSTDNATTAITAAGTAAALSAGVSGSSYLQNSGHPCPSSPAPSAAYVGPVLLLGVA